VWTCIREDFVPIAGFRHERFDARFRSWGAHLDVTSELERA
jgi:hypothetical protein